MEKTVAETIRKFFLDEISSESFSAIFLSLAILETDVPPNFLTMTVILLSL